MDYATSLRRVLLWGEIEGYYYGRDNSYSNYDIAIESKLLKRSWTNVPLG